MSSEVYESVMRGLNEAIAYARGEDTPGVVVHRFDAPGVDVAAIRKQTGLSQDRFAASIGVSAATVRNWEQGRRSPKGPARVLLGLVAKKPDVVQEILRE